MNSITRKIDLLILKFEAINHLGRNLLKAIIRIAIIPRIKITAYYLYQNDFS